MEELIKQIQKKRELSNIHKDVIKNLIEKYTSSKIKQKQLIKLVRADLRNLVGQYQISAKKRKQLIEKKNWQGLLNTHTSTKERLETDAYTQIKNIIKQHNIKSILDLGCGLNPLVLATPNLYYTAIDITKDELNIINQFFKENKIQGKTISQNIIKQHKFPKADICLIFKVFDIIENKTHKIAEKIILSLNCKHILISFPTKKLSGKPMNFPKRLWLEKMLTHHNLKYSTFQTQNEIFYLINN